MIILISGKLVKIKPSVIPNLKSNCWLPVFCPYSLSQFIAKLVITPKFGWTDGGGLTRLYCIQFQFQWIKFIPKQTFESFITTVVYLQFKSYFCKIVWPQNENTGPARLSTKQVDFVTKGDICYNEPEMNNR